MKRQGTNSFVPQSTEENLVFSRCKQATTNSDNSTPNPQPTREPR
jgi:hypothetical protein